MGFGAQTFLIFIVVFLVLCPSGAWAFGAGDIPSFSWIEGKAFRHGDIENILTELLKNAGGDMPSAAGGLLGFAKALVDNASGGAKFSKNDVKRVYFGNWLRDYSQAIDIAGLSKLSADTLVMIVGVLGFMTFGYATEEFEVTADRLGVYLPVEHIDNPKGYAEAEGDARQYHPKLRGPVYSEELEIDPQNGMKNYMASDNRGWDTSTAFIRRRLTASIEYGRRANGEDASLWEAYRLLGTGLHTLEDLLAHSNWCELALRKMGHHQVFCHVGDNVMVDTPNGPAPPMVTGTFGGADFLHSLMGEATDKLSQASVTELTVKMESAQSNDASSQISAIKNILSNFGGGGSDDKVSQGEQFEAKAKAYHFDPDNVLPSDAQTDLWDLLKWRDGVMRDVSNVMESIPGLSDMMEELGNALNEYVYTILTPYLSPVLSQVIAVLDQGSQTVIDNEDQYEVFNNPDASDPSHSLLSKDHFQLILNEPAGKVAQVIVVHTVRCIVQAWSDNSDPDQVINKILEAFHHPHYANGYSQVQNEMFEEFQRWFQGLGSMQDQVLEALTKESVREGKNKRIGSEEHHEVEPGYGGHSHGGGYQSQRTYQTSSYGEHQSGGDYQSGGGYGQQQYGEERREQYSSYSYGGGGDEYSSQRSQYESRNESSYGGGYSSSRQGEGYGGQTNEYGSTGYGQQQAEQSYGQSGHGYGYEGGQRSYGGYGQTEEYSGSGYREDEEKKHKKKKKKHHRRKSDDNSNSEESDDGSNKSSPDSEDFRHYESRGDYGQRGYGYEGRSDDTYGAERLNLGEGGQYEYGRRYGGEGY